MEIKVLPCQEELSDSHLTSSHLHLGLIQQIPKQHWDLNIRPIIVLWLCVFIQQDYPESLKDEFKLL